jgi:hypothetical protein
MNYKIMQKKRISLRLVEDRFLTKKFKSKNQHELSIWFNELAPENEWFTGEIAFKGTHLESLEKKIFAFGVYVNQDYNTINVAELESGDIKSEKELLDSALKGKQIICVFRIENIQQSIWDDSILFQKAIHKALMKYVDKKALNGFRRNLLN